MDPASEAGESYLAAINADLGDEPLEVLAPLNDQLWEDFQRGEGITISKTATQMHERRVERAIQTLNNGAINAMMNQNNLPAQYFVYALMDMAETMAGWIGRRGITRYEHFHGIIPDFRQATGMGFGVLGVCKNPNADSSKGTLSRNELVCCLVSPIGGVNNHLVIRDHDNKNIPVYRGDIVVIHQGELEFTAAEWKTLVPTVCPDTGKIISVKSGTTELFSANKLIHLQHQRQLDPMQPAVLTDAQRDYLQRQYTKITGDRVRRAKDPVINSPNPTYPIPVPMTTSLQPIPSTNTDDLAGDVVENIGGNGDEVDLPWKESEDMEMPEERSPEAWKSEPWSFKHQEVGTRVTGLFQGRLYDGTITRVLVNYVDADGDAYPTIYFAEYDDGDEEEIWGDDDLDHAKKMCQQRQPPTTTAREQRADRRRQRVAVHTASIRLSPKQINRIIQQHNDQPTAQQESKSMWKPEQPLEEDDFACLATAAYDEAGRMRGMDNHGVTSGGHRINPVVSPPQTILPSIPSPTDHTISAPLPRMENIPMYEQQVEDAVGIWRGLYHLCPLVEDYDAMQYLCNMVGGVPTEEQIKEFFSPEAVRRTFDKYQQQQIPAFKARAVRTDNNPSARQVENNEHLQAAFGPAVRKYIDGGLAAGEHYFRAERVSSSIPIFSKKTCRPRCLLLKWVYLKMFHLLFHNYFHALHNTMTKV
jgi:hypothetical protein